MTVARATGQLHLPQSPERRLTVRQITLLLHNWSSRHCRRWCRSHERFRLLCSRPFFSLRSCPPLSGRRLQFLLSRWWWWRWRGSNGRRWRFASDGRGSSSAHLSGVAHAEDEGGDEGEEGGYERRERGAVGGDDPNGELNDLLSRFRGSAIRREGGTGGENSQRSRNPSPLALRSSCRPLCCCCPDLLSPSASPEPTR